MEPASFSYRILISRVNNTRVPAGSTRFFDESTHGGGGCFLPLLPYLFAGHPFPSHEEGGKAKMYFSRTIRGNRKSSPPRKCSLFKRYSARIGCSFRVCAQVTWMVVSVGSVAMANDSWFYIGKISAASSYCLDELLESGLNLYSWWGRKKDKSKIRKRCIFNRWAELREFELKIGE